MVQSWESSGEEREQRRWVYRARWLAQEHLHRGGAHSLFFLAVVSPFPSALCMGGEASNGCSSISISISSSGASLLSLSSSSFSSAPYSLHTHSLSYPLFAFTSSPPPQKTLLSLTPILDHFLLFLGTLSLSSVHTPRLSFLSLELCGRSCINPLC